MRRGTSYAPLAVLHNDRVQTQEDGAGSNDVITLHAVPAAAAALRENPSSV